VVITYDPEDVDEFIAVADAIENAFPSIMVEGVEAEGDRFAINTEDGDRIYASESKQQDPEAIVAALRAFGPAKS